MKRPSIAVFCSAADDISPRYFEESARLGAWIGRQGMALVYGGARLGLMECVAEAAHREGGYIVGVVPDKLVERGMVSALLDEQIPVHSLGERKARMLEDADVFVALPGGLGTLDEVFHVLGEATIGYHDKKVILYNIDGFWNPCMEMIEAMGRQHFLRHPLKEMLLVANHFDELTSQIETALVR